VLKLVAGSSLISFSAVFVKVAHVGPTCSGFYRNLFGALALFLVVLVTRQPLRRGWTPLLFALLAGALFAGDLFAWHRSILYVGPGLATILGNFQVFFLSAIGVFVFRERVTWRFVLALPLAIAGLVLLVGLDWPTLDTRYKIGVALGILTAVLYTGFLLTMRSAQRRPHRLGGIANLAIVSLLTAAFLGVAALVEGESLRIPDTQSWLALVAYGVTCQALGWLLISSALREVEAARAGLILLLQPTLTFIWDILLFGRPTPFVEGVGAILALGAIYLGNTAIPTEHRQKPLAGHVTSVRGDHARRRR
jgi:drug/metabolite transporter (DMT)-like permease